MSNVQLENGYCSLATELVDQFCRYRLSGEEWLVLWAIFRKTYCWHKKEDKIALSTFAGMTGLKRPTVLRALQKLLSKKIIDIIKKDDRQPNTYRFNKHFDTWLSLSKKDTLSSIKIMPVINKDNELSSIKRHSIDIKDTSSKDRKKIPPTLEMVTAYNLKRNNGINPQEYLDANETSGWIMKGGKKVKDWQAQIRTWESNRKKWDKDKLVVRPQTEMEKFARECLANCGGDHDIAQFRFLAKYTTDDILKVKHIIYL